MDDALLKQNGPQSPDTVDQGLGGRFIALGQALNNPDSTLRDLVSLAYDCGLIFSVRVEARDPVEVAMDLEPRH
jgi:hypothetical protein